MRPTTPSSARLICAISSTAITGPISSLWRPTTRAAEELPNGSRNSAIRAIRRSIRSIGSSASRSPRPGNTWSRSWRRCSFTGRGWPVPTRRCNSCKISIAAGGRLARPRQSFRFRPNRSRSPPCDLTAREACPFPNFVNSESAPRALPTVLDTLQGLILNMPEPAGELWQDLTYASFGDLRLNVRHYKAPAAKSRSVICLPGLTRNGRDFHTLATYLSRYAEKPRDLYCFDYRGRGRSQYDRNWRNYVPYIELLDILDFLTINGLHKVGIVGTSRGGIVAMLMAALRPTAMGPVVLNDIGAVIETRGLARIINYVRRMPNPRSWPNAVMIVREINERTFPNLTDAEWEEMARAIFDERKGRPVRAYDRTLARA